MAKRSVSKKRKKRNRKKEAVHTSHATLAALGPIIAEKKVFSPIHQLVSIDQKTIEYRPTDKLIFATLGFIAGVEAVYEINTVLRPNVGLLKAFGYEKCADFSVIQQTLNAATLENVTQLQSALEQIFKANNLTEALVEQSQEKDSPVTLDIDLSGQPASAKAQHSTKGYFAKAKNTTGRQLARVVVAETQEIVTETLYPGNRLSMFVLKDQVAKLESRLDLETPALRSRVRLRLDAGFGTDENINYLQRLCYEILVKVYSWQRSHSLAQSVTTWGRVAKDAENNLREVGWVTTPHRYARKTRQCAIRTPKKKGGYSYHVLVTSDMSASLEEVIADYDARSGAPESTFCQDSQGLNLKKRRFHSFVAQQVLILLSQLAHNLIRWVQSWLQTAVLAPKAYVEADTDSATGQMGSKVIKSLKERGIKRMIRQVLSLDGKVVFKRGKVKQILLNPLSPLIHRILTAFRRLLEPLKIQVSLDEI